MKRKNQHIYSLAILVSQGVILNFIENKFPSFFVFAPGIKLGIANLITLIALFTFPTRQTLLLVVSRVLLASFLCGSGSTLLYSFTGGILAFFAMYLAKQLGKKRISFIGISILGSFFNNLGQLAVASFLTESNQLMIYLPISTFLSILTGFFIGSVGNYFFHHLPKGILPLNDPF